MTIYKETDKGELILEELELEVKVKSSRIGQFPSAVRQVNGAPKESAVDKTREETCW